MAKKQSHTGFRNGDIFCFNCGTSQKMPLPMPVDLAAGFMKLFDKKHKTCEKTWIEPVNDPTNKSTHENAHWWLVNGEHGMSSEVMFMRFCDFGLSATYSSYLSDSFSNLRISHPCDSDDFRRCYLLIKTVPQWKEKLDRMKSVSDVWRKIIDNWDKLCEMLEEQMKTNKPNGMYEFMKSIGC